MSTSRFLLTNRLLTATLKNGTGGGAPVRDEVAPYTMEMLQNAERYSPWKNSATTTFPFQIDYDLGSALSCSGAFALAYRAITGNFLTCSVYSASAYGPGPWTLRGVLSGVNLRDMGVEWAAVSARYWRFDFDGVSGQFTLGRLALGSLNDLAAIHSPGGTDSPRGARLIQSVPGGEMFVTDLSVDIGREITLPFRGITDSLKATLETIATTAGTVILYDARDLAYECVVPDRTLAVTRQFYNGSQHIYDCELRLLRLT